MTGLIDYFAGYAVMREREGYKNAAIALLQRRGIAFYDVHEKDGATYFRIRRRHLSEPGLSLCAETVYEKGFIPDLLKSLKRPGLYIGALIFAAGLVFSDMIVWDVRFVCNGNENRQRIEAAADRCGIRCGALKTSVDRRAAEAFIMAGCPDVSYVRINYEGNTAVVVTDERIIPAPAHDSGADLTASEDGYILRYETYSGRTVCEKGQTVKRGDVLISGSYETFHHGTANTAARGKVYALVRRSFVCAVPLTVTEKEYTGKETVTHTLSLFSRELGKKRTAQKENTDVITDERAVTVFGAVELPLRIKTTTEREYVKVKRQVKENEARAELEAMCEKQYAEITADAVRVDGCEKTYTVEDGKYKLYCEIWLVCNIAR